MRGILTLYGAELQLYGQPLVLYYEPTGSASGAVLLVWRRRRR